MPDTPTTAPATGTQANQTGPAAVTPEAAPSAGDSDIASQIDALLAHVESTQEAINAVFDESPDEIQLTQDTPATQTTQVTDNPLADPVASDGNVHDPADPLTSLAAASTALTDSIDPADPASVQPPGPSAASIASQIDELVSAIPGSAESSALTAAPDDAPAKEPPPAPTSSAPLETGQAQPDSASNAPAAPDQDIASQVSNLLASLPEVLNTTEANGALTPPETGPEVMEALSDHSRPDAAAGPPSDGSIDEQIATLTNNLIRSESPSAERLAEIISPEPRPVPPPAADSGASSVAASTHQPEPSSAPSSHEAASLHGEASPPKPSAVQVLTASLGAGGRRLAAGANSGLELMGAPLASRPALAKGLGWISLNTIFLAACLWAFLIFVRLPAVENVKASAFDFSHGSLPAPQPPHPAAGSHAAEGKDDGHGAAAGGHGEKDAGGHDSKKAGTKKASSKKEPAKKEPAKKDAKKDAKKPAGGH